MAHITLCCVQMLGIDMQRAQSRCQTAHGAPAMLRRRGVPCSHLCQFCQRFNGLEWCPWLVRSLLVQGALVHGWFRCRVRGRALTVCT
eukprot:10495330-Alexandrium_andersonii.AAC.1